MNTSLLSMKLTPEQMNLLNRVPEHIRVAYAEGKTIQHKCASTYAVDNEDWIDVDKDNSQDLLCSNKPSEWRVKPEPVKPSTSVKL